MQTKPPLRPLMPRSARSSTSRKARCCQIWLSLVTSICPSYLWRHCPVFQLLPPLSQKTSQAYGSSLSIPKGAEVIRRQSGWPAQIPGAQHSSHRPAAHSRGDSFLGAKDSIAEVTVGLGWATPHKTAPIPSDTVLLLASNSSWCSGCAVGEDRLTAHSFLRR
jgi:hypothetical protein